MDNRTIEQIRDNETRLIKELIQKENIIKEVREYIKHSQNYGKEKIIYVNGNDILEILGGENNVEI